METLTDFQTHKTRLKYVKWKLLPSCSKGCQIQETRRMQLFSGQPPLPQEPELNDSSNYITQSKVRQHVSNLDSSGSNNLCATLLLDLKFTSLPEMQHQETCPKPIISQKFLDYEDKSRCSLSITSKQTPMKSSTTRKLTPHTYSLTIWQVVSLQCYNANANDTRECDKFSSYGYLTSSNRTIHIHEILLQEITYIFLGHFTAIRRIHEFRVISAAALVGGGSQSSHCRHHPHFLHRQFILQALKNTKSHIQYNTKTHSLIGFE